MSPEQARGEPTDHRTDLFSLGSVLYALCTGRPPFRGDTTAAILKQVCEATPRPIRETNPDIPEWLCDLIGRLHAKEAYDRIGSARDVADLLSARLTLLQESPRVPPAAVEPSRSLRAEAAVARPPAVPPSRRRWVVFACLVALLLALAALAALVGLGINKGGP
jgi:serine/threonine protein kinase